MKDDDDKDLSLHELSLDYGASIISQLVDIGNERNQQRHVKFRPFISRLQCLRPEGTQLLRTSINAFNEPHHRRCIQKRDALQAMDLVYQLSKHPVALLARPVQMKSELDLLGHILSGNLVEGNRNIRLSQATTVHKAKKALWLLREITRDICRIELPPDDVCRVNDVLRAAGRYTEMLPKSSAMTPTIVADIEARGLLKPWDRLAILANCCQYPVRLDYEALNKQRRSLSLSILAMCLLNGEILDNNDCNQELVAPLTTARPSGWHLTKGHLWKLSRVIDTSKFKKKLPWINIPRGRLTLNKRKHLLQLVFRLNDLGHRPLANWIDKYLADDANSNAQEDYISFTEMYLHRMAAELAAAIKARRKLRLGSIWDPTGRSAPYGAVFVWADKDEDKGEAHPPLAFVFTSAWFRDPGSKTYEANDIHRHVSLEVSLEKSPDSADVPHLRVAGGCSCFPGRESFRQLSLSNKLGDKLSEEE
ncbi:hypothetical protein M441DRAFT_90659 [Trichoderma asperellum CBS 433.97]|uniref:Uncharacterized protein n=1 Tax=Trichoderma asperellum (strain ATCC 204424 / CBS 433.97 / NBRC 101777) TaxID=1042311 RepID=A0A2T3Z6P3_TRIA4|nr:hypothetical protein M441DRAFT_90659 [Trichoderma asperellum CBS 433.97]PTB40445.1 hypothetical protein M441DRAFT_90659 [Trichoderma asperellum CBS 433.97]